MQFQVNLRSHAVAMSIQLVHFDVSYLFCWCFELRLQESMHAFETVESTHADWHECMGTFTKLIWFSWDDAQGLGCGAEAAVVLEEHFGRACVSIMWDPVHSKTRLHAKCKWYVTTMAKCFNMVYGNVNRYMVPIWHRTNQWTYWKIQFQVSHGKRRILMCFCPTPNNWRPNRNNWSLEWFLLLSLRQPLHQSYISEHRCIVFKN